ncbi:N-acetylornithine carbamoyltransferase [Belliella pelovolcani]|uniref:N-acetylornithine carbamoyltransferase n=1 Tax=Belliella pelovolcani TaxID=529505 RepID=UPI00391D1DC1
MKHFTQFENKSLADRLIEKALAYKNNPRIDISKGLGKRVGCIFLNPSLRTRASTQIAAMNLGMEAIVMNMDKEGWAIEMKEGAIMNKGAVEHIKDAAAVLGTYFDVLAVRAFPSLVDKKEDTEDYIFNQFIKYSGIPVVSLESAIRHPLQSLADMVTIQEHMLSGVKPKVVLTWAPHIKAIPHAVANSFAEWAVGCGYDLTITHPEGYELDEKFTKGATIEYDQDKALVGADFVYVKNWSAFNDYGKIHTTDPDWMLRESHFKNASGAKVMHCLPVRRNVELSDEVLDGQRSLVQKQAENRIYAAQAVLSMIIE